MANNIDVTPGTGKTVASEDVGGSQYQKIKLIEATAASSTPTGVAANPLQVSLANTAANATAVKTDGSAVTQPISAAALPLPTGAATSALQTQPGVDIGDVTINNGAAGAAVNIQDGGNTITVDGTVAVSGSVAVTNAGTFAVQESGTQVQVDDAAFTPATSKIVMAGFQADETATDSVDEGDGGAGRMTLDRKQIVTLQPHTNGGWSTFMATSGDGSTALTNSAQAVKASAGKLGGWYIYNPNAAATYVIIYNVASGSVTVGTTNPQIVLCIPPTSAANVEFANGITFTTAIAVAATTTGGGNTAPTTALEANFFYF